MSEVPDHIATRRAQERARRRRRRLIRRTAAAVALVAVVAVVAVLAASLFGGSGSRPTPGKVPIASRSLAVPTPSGGARRVRGAPADARAVGAIRRLIALGLPIYCGGPHGNAVAFTFDDGPGVYTHYAVKKLTGAHEQATFFVVGKEIVAWPGWLRREIRVAALGDHTYHHLDLEELPASEVYDEIESTKLMIERDSGRPVYFFRPPYGAHDAVVDAIVKRLGLLEVLWSVDSADSLGANYAGIIANVEQGLRPGAIIEMHENRGQTIRALTTLLPELRRRHMRSVSLLTLMATDPPSDAQVRRGEAACGGPSDVAGRGSE
jgi:peptidoglycan/xylan/chitin deacetylase (PgdA/CDA1 family)